MPRPERPGLVAAAVRASFPRAPRAGRTRSSQGRRFVTIASARAAAILRCLIALTELRLFESAAQVRRL